MKITKIKIIGSSIKAYEASDAKIYVGDMKTPIATMPSEVSKDKVYTFCCETQGNMIKIVTGRDDGMLRFNGVEIYHELTHAELFFWHVDPDYEHSQFD